MKIKHISLLLIVLMIVPMSLSDTFASTPITAEGLAAVVGGNSAIARDQAVNDAQRKAVEQAVGTMISSQTVMENYEVLSDSIYSRTQGYIQNYRIVSEKQEGNLYYTTISANVATGELKNELSALGLLLARKSMPRVMIMVAEQNVGMEYYTYWWSALSGKGNVVAGHADLTVTENILMQKLSEKGFNIVDHSVMAKNVRLSKAYKIEALTDNAIQQAGSMYGAEVVIYGKALAKLAGSVKGTSMKSSQADLSLRVVNTDNGQVIASATHHAAAVHPSEVASGTEALKKAAEGIAEDLIGQIVSRWGREVSGSTMVQMEITGVGSYSNLVKFKQALKTSVRGISGVHQRSFTAGIALLDVESSGTAQEVADQLAITPFPGFAVEITNITQNTINMRMMSR